MSLPPRWQWALAGALLLAGCLAPPAPHSGVLASPGSWVAVQDSAEARMWEIPAPQGASPAEICELLADEIRAKNPYGVEDCYATPIHVAPLDGSPSFVAYDLWVQTTSEAIQQGAHSNVSDNFEPVTVGPDFRRHCGLGHFFRYRRGGEEIVILRFIRPDRDC